MAESSYRILFLRGRSSRLVLYRMVIRLLLPLVYTVFRFESRLLDCRFSKEFYGRLVALF